MRVQISVNNILKLGKRWFPLRSFDSMRSEIARFYETSEAYHEMTKGGDKTLHPQVKLLTALLLPEKHYLEVGCGSGEVCRVVGRAAYVTGVDVSPIAINNAKKRQSGNEVYVQTEAETLPFADNEFDGVYSFEFLEHSWRVKDALKEMVRVIKPGGFLLLSAPNGFSLDIHLHKRAAVRFVEGVLAAVRLVMNKVAGSVCIPIKPDIAGEVYPDCDMVSALVPENIEKFLSQLGMQLEFWDTFYMCSHREGSVTDLNFQRLCKHSFFKHFGDHILLLAYKK